MRRFFYLIILGALIANQLHAQPSIKPIEPDKLSILNKYDKCLIDQIAILEPSEAPFDDIFLAAVWMCKTEKSMAWGELTKWQKSQPDQAIQTSWSASQILDDWEKNASTRLRYYTLKDRALRKKTIRAANQ